MGIRMLGAAAGLMLSMLFVSSGNAVTKSQFCGQQNRECLRGCPWIARNTSTTVEGCHRVCADRLSTCQATGCFAWLRKPAACYTSGAAEK